jgi:hypothetical protein
VRVGIIPFSAPVNIAYAGSEFPGLGMELTEELQRRLMETGALPIVEILNRQDWPGKKEEFNTGNFHALVMARDAGYDLIIVGSVERVNDLKTLAAMVRLIEVESGTTVYVGRSSVTNAADGNLLDNIPMPCGGILLSASRQGCFRRNLNPKSQIRLPMQLRRIRFSKFRNRRRSADGGNQPMFHLVNNPTNWNCSPSNNPRSPSFSFGITSSARKESVINGAGSCEPICLARRSRSS